MKTKDWHYPFWIAHRGGGTIAPENTLAAFRVGAAHGYQAFECDVKLSADGLPFLLHDATLDRTTNGQGPAATQTWDSLSRLDAGTWFGPAFAGEPLPLLAGIARFCRDQGSALNIEIKPSPGHEAETGRVVARLAQAAWEGAAVPPLLSSFRPEALDSAREAAPDLPRALLIEHLADGWFETATGLGCVAVIAHHRLIDAAWVRGLHAAGMRACSYTVNDLDTAQRLEAAGIDGLITDAIDRFSPSRRALNAPRV